MSLITEQRDGDAEQPVDISGHVTRNATVSRAAEKCVFFSLPRFTPLVLSFVLFSP